MSQQQQQTNLFISALQFITKIILFPICTFLIVTGILSFVLLICINSVFYPNANKKMFRVLKKYDDQCSSQEEKQT
jgi:hypothetical protein